MTNSKPNPLALLDTVINTMAVFEDQHGPMAEALSVLLEDECDRLGIHPVEFDSIFETHRIDPNAWEEVRERAHDIYRRCLAIRETLRDAKSRYAGPVGGGE